MVVTMLASGALAGLAGATLQMGYLHHIDAGSFVTNFGFIAVITALVGRKHMVGIGVASLFFGYLTIGAEAMAAQTGVTTAVVFAMEGVMMVGILLSSYLGAALSKLWSGVGGLSRRLTKKGSSVPSGLGGELSAR
jgi:simple sugar transport system permease protein